jgi:2-dehydropantoate 2-reductase
MFQSQVYSAPACCRTWRNKKTEVDFINGIVLQKGIELAIDTPYNARVIEMVKEAEKNRRIPQFSANIKVFQALLKD